MPKLAAAITVLLPVCLFAQTVSAPAPSSEATYSALAKSQLRQARETVERLRPLVANGTLAPARLEQAEEQLRDAEDQETLARTLYGPLRVEHLTDDEAASMKAAAERRVARQQKIWDTRRNLLESGVLARADLEEAQLELDHRKQVAQLVEARLELLGELKRMAESERQAELRARSGTLSASLIRYNGSGIFRLSDLPRLSGKFQKQFGHALPVSATGQTAVHTALGLDHRNRVDIALNPESKEGLWFRQLLEQLHLPYLAFRSAVFGAATAPHIHLGAGSSRLRTP